MNILCKIFGHKFQYKYNVDVIPPGEGIRGKLIYVGVPGLNRHAHYECTRRGCNKEKDIRITS